MPVDAKQNIRLRRLRLFSLILMTPFVSKTGYIPESIKAVFKGLKEKGILTGIATGRGYYGVVEEILDLEPDYFVTINGTYVINRKGKKFIISPLLVKLLKLLLLGAKRLGLLGASLVRISQLSQNVQN